MINLLFQIIMISVSISMVLNVETSLRFWENKGWINPTDLYGWFQ